MTKETLSNLPQESRRFDPPPELAAHANATAGAYKEAAAGRLAFWADKARPLDVAEHRSLGDVTTLTGSTVMELISGQPPMAKSGG